ncbi:MAG: serine/threonine-protein kinase [Aquihabitans sp.]
MRTTAMGHRLDLLLHRGNDHDVWLARPPDLGRPVVIKRRSNATDRGDTRSLVREAEVLATLAHPNLVELIGVVDDPPGVMLVMPWIEGGSLRDLLEERGSLSPGELIAVLEGVAGALSHMADRHLVHGDLRPDHVLLTAHGHPVLIGLGAAMSMDHPVSEAQVVGVSQDPDYLHPAVAAGGRPDARFDVYSLAVVAYQCLTGRMPHRGTPAEVLALAAAGVHRPLTSWPSVPTEVADEIEQALTPDGPDVPTDAATFVERLRAVVDPNTVSHPRPRADLIGNQLGRSGDETLPFGPTPPRTVAEPRPPGAWRLLAAALIATLTVAVLWFLAGVALAV